MPFDILSKELALVTSAFFKRQEYEASLDVLESQPTLTAALVTETVGLGTVPAVFETLKKPYPPLQGADRPLAVAVLPQLSGRRRSRLRLRRSWPSKFRGRASRSTRRRGAARRSVWCR